MNELNKYHFIINSLNKAIIILDSKSNIIYFNQFASTIFSLNTQQDKTLKTCFNKNNNKIINDNIKRIKKNNTNTFTIKHNNYIFEIACSYINNSVFENAFFLIFDDITKTKKNETINLCLYEISEAIYNSNDLESLYKDIHSAITKITNANNFYIALFDKLNKKLSFPYFIDKKDKKPKDRTMGKGLTEYVINTGETILLNKESYNKFILNNKIKTIGSKTFNWIGIPLKIVRDKTIGMMCVQSYKQSNTFNENDKIALQHISNQVAIAINEKRDNIKMHKQAHFDELTGLTNKSLFYDRLDIAIHQARRNDEVIGVMFLDLDDFKIINDTLGHSSGDKLLSIVGKILKDSVRRGDTVSRWGGDEFTIILPSIKDIAGIKSLCDRILNKHFKNIKMNNKKINLNASVGIALYPDDGHKVNTLINNADKAMYHAKNNGKNNYIFFKNIN